MLLVYEKHKSRQNARAFVWTRVLVARNGSVPNLYELLSPAKERSKTFLIGRDFDPDPVKVGADTSRASGKFLFDASQFGNSSIDHSFQNGSGPGVIGPLVTEEAAWTRIGSRPGIGERGEGRVSSRLLRAPAQRGQRLLGKRRLCYRARSVGMGPRREGLHGS